MSNCPVSLFSSKNFSPSLLGSLSLLLTVSPHHMLLVLGLTLITAIKVTKRRLPGTIMEVGAHLKSLLKIKMVWILDHGVLENGCSSIVIIDQFWDGSFIYRPIGIWSFVYQLIGIWSFIYVCSAAQHSFLVCQRARRIANQSIFSPTERVMRW